MTEPHSGHVKARAGAEPSGAPSSPAWVPAAILAGAALIAVLGAGMLRRTAERANKITLDATPKPVAVVRARTATYQPARHFPATLEPSVAAKLGPQLVSAYVQTVAVRPGAVVKRGDVLATLDCRKDAAASQALAMRAKELEIRQGVAAKEAERLGELHQGGFVATNDVDRKVAESSSRLATLASARADLRGSVIEVDDCTLKAPFDGEVSERYVDPGAYVRPGGAVLRVVDRSAVRVVIAVPESDFAYVAPGTRVGVRVVATGVMTSAVVSRRAPRADAVNRTIRVEIDLVDGASEIPVGTTAEVLVAAGAAAEALELPLHAATIHGDVASLFVVSGDVAKKLRVRVLGEASGSVFIEPGDVREGDLVIIQGRALLADADRVQATKGQLDRADE